MSRNLIHIRNLDDVRAINAFLNEYACPQCWRTVHLQELGFYCRTCTLFITTGVIGGIVLEYVGMVPTHEGTEIPTTGTNPRVREVRDSQGRISYQAEPERLEPVVHESVNMFEFPERVQDLLRTEEEYHVRPQVEAYEDAVRRVDGQLRAMLERMPPYRLSGETLTEAYFRMERMAAMEMRARLALQMNNPRDFINITTGT